MSTRRVGYLLIVLLAALIAAGCSSTRKSGDSGTRYGGGYYQDDGPGDRQLSNAELDAIPDAVPRNDPLASGSNRPYVVFGERYVPDTAERPFRQQGVASWYGRKFHGAKTSSGERYDMYAMTAAHPTLPIPSYARVTSKINGKSVIVRVNDRGPFHSKRIMDLSYTAAYKLGLIGSGSGEVIVERILPSEIRTMMAQGPNTPGDSQLMNDEAVAPVTMPAPAQIAGEPVDIPAPAAAVASAERGFYLQLGAFSKPDNAQTLASKVNTQLGRNTRQRAVAALNAKLYRVRVGPYASREAAMSDVKTINAKTGILPSVIAP